MLQDERGAKHGAHVPVRVWCVQSEDRHGKGEEEMIATNDDPCVCKTCEGKGESSEDVDCDCDGCSGGEHTLYTDCGESADIE